MDESVLLCVRCGYEIDGLHTDTTCPECGLPVHDSLPRSRPGTPLQHGGAAAPFRMILALLRRPGQVMGEMIVEEESNARRLMHRQFALPGLLTAIGLATMVAMRDREIWMDLGAFVQTMAALAAFFVGVTIVVGVLTQIEVVGVRFWGNRRGRRVTRRIALNVCAHASCGWIAGGILVAIGFPLGWLLEEFAIARNVGIARGPFLLAQVVLPTLGFITGMLLFEFWTWKGIQANRFANVD